MIFSNLFDYAVLAYSVVAQRLGSTVPLRAGISHTSLPRQAVFPGLWEEYIKAPYDKSRIRPGKLWHTEGSVSSPEAVLNWQESNSSTTLGPGGLITLEFPENIAGR